MKHVITYSLVFVGAMALAGAGGFLLTPAKSAPAKNNEATVPSKPDTTIVEEEDDDFGDFIPVENTPVDFLLDNLFQMKSLNATGAINVNASGYELSLQNIDLYLTLSSFSNINVELDALIEYHKATTPLSVSFLNDTIYCSLLGNDIKMETSDFMDVTDIIDSFGIKMETPSTFENINLDSLMEDFSSMSYSSLVEGGYEFSLNLLGLNIYLTCDDNYFLSSANIKGEIEGIEIEVDLNTEIHQEIANKIVAPETNERVYQPFNSFLPFVRDLGRLAGETQFGIDLTASIVSDNATEGMSINGDLQFDVQNNSGEGKLSIVDYSDKTYVTDKSAIYPTHNIEINVDDEDMKFKYNEGMYGKFTLNTLTGLFEVITEFIGSDNPIMLLINDRFTMPDLGDSTISHLANGEFELLFNDYITKLYADDTMLDIVISKDLLGMECDLELILGIDNEKHISYLEVPELSMSGMNISFRASFKDYNAEYVKLPAENEAKYFDFSEIKFLLSIGLNTAEISYFHLKGELNLPMKLAGIFDLSGLAKDIAFDMEIFNDMSKMTTHVIGKLTNIPLIAIINSPLIGGPKSRSLEIYYDDECIYLNRVDTYSRKTETTSCKVTPAQMMEDMNILKYLIGFGFGISDSMMKTIMDAMTKENPRTAPLDFSKIFNDYIYKTDVQVSRYDGTKQTYARQWDLNINVAELANNPDLKSLVVNIYGGPVAGLEGEYLQYITVDFNISAGGIFNCTVDLNGELIDIDPLMTPAVYKYMENYKALFAYCEAHANDGPLTFSY